MDVWKDSFGGVREAVQRRGEGLGPQRFGARQTCLHSDPDSATPGVFLSFLFREGGLATLAHSSWRMK